MSITRVEDEVKIGLRRAFGSPWLRLGSLKGFADGSLGSTTACFFEPYLDAPGTSGILDKQMQPLSQMRDRLLLADGAGQQICLHAIGDRAISIVLDLFEDVIKAGGRKDRRLRIEHAQHMAPKDFDRFRSLNVIASMQPTHCIDDGRWAEKRIGPERAKTTYAFRTFLDKGVRLAFGTDWPVASLNPMVSLFAAVTRQTTDGKNPGGWVPEQKISLAEAIEAYTMGSAYAEFQEGEKGSLTAGKLADMVLLSENIFAIPPAQLENVKVLATWVNGRQVHGQPWKPQTSGSKASFRGLCAVSPTVAWASGYEGEAANGTVLRTVDGGQTWQSRPVPGAERLEFRDVEALDQDTAWVLSSGNGADSRIYKTVDGGAHWALQFQNQRPEAFFDALAFWDPQHGIALSDPVDGRFVLITTTNGGASWQPVLASALPPALPKETAFAASGTCLTVQGGSHVWFGTGGAGVGRVFHSANRGETWSVTETPIVADKESAGIFSLAFRDEQNGIAVGGDYARPEHTGRNIAFTYDGGRTWQAGSDHVPRGFRSGVAWMRGPEGWLLLAVGPSGADVAEPGGAWRQLDSENYNCVSVARFDGRAAWAAGRRGRIARLQEAAR